MAEKTYGIVIDGERITLQRTPIAGDVAITPEGVSTIGTGKITIDMIDPDVKKYFLPIAQVDLGRVDYCVVG